jgi:acyl-CoA synthetase (AMP-forming)/AMP-acid ligase II
LQGISKYRVTFSVGPNFAYDLCARKVTAEQRSRLDLRSWCWAGNGAEPIRPETLERFLACFEPCGFQAATFCPGYGLAEATLKVTGGSLGDHLRFLTVDAEALEQHQVVPRADRGAAGTRTLVSCGRVALETRVRIVDPESCIECPEDSVGEIWVSGPTVAAGYWNRPFETEETFRARLADGDEGPYLRTGDLGFLHEDNLYVTGRLKDVIIIDGANHYPQDIEHTVETSHPAVRPGCCAAFSVEGERAEQVVVAVEVNGAPLKETESKTIISAIRRAISERHDLRVHKICLILPRTIHKTSSGKLQRHACRHAFLSGALELVAAG